MSDGVQSSPLEVEAGSGSGSGNYVDYVTWMIRKVATKNVLHLVSQMYLAVFMPKC